MISIMGFIRILVSFVVAVNLFPMALMVCAAPAGSTTTGLKVFEYLPLYDEPSLEIHYRPLQFNGSVPGAGDTDEHVGWYFGKTPSSQNNPVDLVSFVQGNKKEGIVFWASNTALQTYLEPVPGVEGTYAARNGYTTNPKALTNDFTITELDIGSFQKKWIFGWKGKSNAWFVCRNKHSGFLGLYFGNHMDGCSKPFFLEAKYL